MGEKVGLPADFIKMIEREFAASAEASSLLAERLPTAGMGRRDMDALYLLRANARAMALAAESLVLAVRLQDGDLEETEDIDLTEMMRAASRRWRAAMMLKRLRARIVLPSEKDCMVKGNRRLMEILLDNLLAASIRLSSKGGITITLNCAHVGDSVNVRMDLKGGDPSMLVEKLPEEILPVVPVDTSDPVALINDPMASLPFAAAFAQGLSGVVLAWQQGGRAYIRADYSLEMGCRQEHQETEPMSAIYRALSNNDFPALESAARLLREYAEGSGDEKLRRNAFGLELSARSQDRERARRQFAKIAEMRGKTKEVEHADFNS